MAKRFDKAKSKVRIGDLDTMVKIRMRNISEPKFGTVDFGEEFSDHIDVWASVTTAKGKAEGRSLFAEVNQETLVTHTVDIRYEPGINSEMWIELEGSILLDIVKTENIDNDFEFLRIVCTERGATDKEAAQV